MGIQAISSAALYIQLYMQGQSNSVIAELKQQLQQAATAVANQETERATAKLAAQQEAHSSVLLQLKVSPAQHDHACTF